MPLRLLIVSLLLNGFLVNTAVACAVGPEGKASTQLRKSVEKMFAKKKRQVSNVDLKPFAQGHPDPSWESRLGNLLLKHPSTKEMRVTLSLPAHIQRGCFHPYGDGQSNAKMNMAQTWKLKDFPAVGIQTEQDKKVHRQYQFHDSLKVTGYQEVALTDGWYEVRPDGKGQSFYFNFRSEVITKDNFLKGIPESLRTFPPDRVAPNIAGISKKNAYQELQTRDLGPGYNSKNPWPADNVHGLFPDGKGEKTALGGVYTWGIKTQSHEVGAFKNLYTCFAPRDPAAETNDINGIPSGAGWHHVGDVAETILNTIGENAIPFAVARTHGKTDSAFDLQETITATWILEDEVQVTRRNEFHWYLNPYEAEVCTELWVHLCVPDLKNNWGFNCPKF